MAKPDDVLLPKGTVNLTLSAAQRSTVLRALGVLRAVVARQLRAEENTSVIEIRRQEIAFIESLVSFVSTGQVAI